MSKRFKVVFVISMAIILMFSWSGFLFAEYDIKNTTVIQGIGIDFDEEKDEYVVLLRVFDISPGAGTDEAVDGNQTKVIKVSGTSISSAMDKVTLEIGKTLVFSQKRIVIIGESALEKGVADITDFFIREYKTRSNVLMAATTECSAEEVMYANEANASFPAREIQTLLKSGDISGYTTEVNFATLTASLEDNFSDSYLPVLKVRNDNKNEYACLDGFVILKGGFPTGKLDLETGRGMLFVNDLIKGGTLKLDNEEIGFVTLKIVDNKSSVRVSADDIPTVDLKINCTADITEIQSGDNEEIGRKDIEKLESLVEKDIGKSVRKALDLCLDDYHSDVFGFGRRLWIMYPSYCKGREDYVKGLIDSASVSVSVNAEIRRSGQEKT